MAQRTLPACSAIAGLLSKTEEGKPVPACAGYARSDTTEGNMAFAVVLEAILKYLYTDQPALVLACEFGAGGWQPEIVVSLSPALPRGRELREEAAGCPQPQIGISRQFTGPLLCSFTEVLQQAPVNARQSV